MENYAILLKGTDTGEGREGKLKMIGTIGIARLSADEEYAEVGYGILEKFWGVGYATETLRLFVDHYFNSERKLPLPFLTLVFLNGTVLDDIKGKCRKK